MTRASMPGNAMEAVRLVTRLAHKMHEQGRASLLEDAEHADNALLRDGLRWIAEDRPEPEVKAALGRQVTEARASLGPNLDVRRMVEAGLLSMHAGDDPDTVRSKMEAFLTPQEMDALTGRL